MSKIRALSGREIFNSAGLPVLEVTVVLENGIEASSTIAQSHSKGTFEDKDVYDNDPARYKGKGMIKSVVAVANTIQPKLKGVEVFEQQKVDAILKELDGTENKSVLGANVMLTISQAVARAAAKASSIPLFLYLRQFTSLRETALKLPLPMFTLIEGGKWVKGGIDFQSVLLLPASSRDLYSSIEMGIDLTHKLHDFLDERNSIILNAPLGGFPAMSHTNADAVNLMKQFIESSSYKFSQDLFLGIDANANVLVNGQTYRIQDRPNPINAAELKEFYKMLVDDYSVLFIEDPYSDLDTKAWIDLTQALSDEVMISADDLVGGSPLRLQSLIEGGYANSVSFTPGQIGTISESLAFAEIARYKKLKLTVYDRGYTTDDTFLVDFAVAVGAEYLKSGAPLRERVFKYNRLLGIDKEVDALR